MRFVVWSVCGLMMGAACGWPSFSVRAQEKESQATNRLARETSPYLLLHAHNPVDWYPWGPEAFEKARRENKLIFLSIGYSSCYWCHVMERQVFTNKEAAQFLNEHFVCIKVDREERPDVDDLYMLALQVYFQATGNPQTGGWPLSMFLTPDLKPLGGGTYFPLDDTPDRDGFLTITERIHQAWTDKPDDLRKNAEIITRIVKTQSEQRAPLAPIPLEQSLVNVAATALGETYDPEYAGFDFSAKQPRRPKFPVPVKLAFLQDWLAYQSDAEMADKLFNTLDRMAAGGIHDQLGGGFHRYSTDRVWLVPHFEKMLYDNAQLADLYVSVYSTSRNPKYQRIAEDILGFVLREMTDPQGGFYSALDAETEGVEGKFYLWTRAELQEVLDADDVRLCSLHYGLDRAPDLEESYVLAVQRDSEELAKSLDMPLTMVEERLQTIRQKLFAVRRKRAPLLKDDKILTSWNGLMIRALAHAGKVFQQPDYLRAAQKAAVFLMSKVRDDQGRLLRTWRADQAKYAAYLEDYAFLIEGLLAIYDATQDEKWLNAAKRLQAQQIELFGDAQQPGYFFTSKDGEPLLVRSKPWYDSVIPSGNSTTVRNLVRLADLTGDSEYLSLAEETLTAGAPVLSETPRGTANLALALQEFLILKKEIGKNTPPASTENVPEEPADNNSKIQLAADQQPAKIERAKPKTKAKVPDHVTGEVFLSHEPLQAGGKAQFLIVLKIKEGWHINPNPAPDEFTIATELTLESPHKLEIGKVAYPKPKQKKVEGLAKTLQYYEGEIQLRGEVIIPKEAAGMKDELEFVVEYQACSDKTCLRPTKLPLIVPVTIARAGQPGKPQHSELFTPPTTTKKKTSTK